MTENDIFEDITMLNSPEWFNFVNEGKHVSYNNIRISATTSSVNRIANTDGWDVYRSDDVSITNSNINNGDDCVSFKPSTSYSDRYHLLMDMLMAIFHQMQRISL